jgi:hypothetical protein
MVEVSTIFDIQSPGASAGRHTSRGASLARSPAGRGRSSWSSARLFDAFKVHSAINKLLVLNGDFRGRTDVVLIKDTIGI